MTVITDRIGRAEGNGSLRVVNPARGCPTGLGVGIQAAFLAKFDAYPCGASARYQSGDRLFPRRGGRVSAPRGAGSRASHEQALAAAAFGMSSRSGRWLFDYADVDMLVMLSAQADLARQFVLRELGGLAGPGDTAVTLRATLKCYLDTEHSLSAAADRLHVARNTVAYRVQRAEQLRGRPIDSRRMQLQAALTLAEELGDNVLGDSADS